MTAIGIEVREVVRQCRPALAETLKANGIRVMPTAWAEDHKRAFLKEVRSQGYGSLATYLLLSLRWTILTLSLIYIPVRLWWENREHGYRIGWIYITAIIALTVGGVFFSLAHDEFYWWMFVPVLSAIAAIVFELRRGHPEPTRLGHTTGQWVSYRLVIEEDLRQAPATLRERAAEAAKIPEVRLYHEVLDNDPLVYAVRGWGPFKEVCYLGGYMTNNPRIDQF